MRDTGADPNLRPCEQCDGMGTVAHGATCPNCKGEGFLPRTPKGPIFTIPEGTPASTCKGCGATFYWVQTRSGRAMPVDPDGLSHFATCPAAAKFRKPKKGGRT